MSDTRNRGQKPNLDLQKRGAPLGRREKLYERMERELSNLKRDQRYWDGDTDYLNYVHRQFERVYNDPSGKTRSLRIGAPKIFATKIEPFEVTDKATHHGEASVGRVGATRISGVSLTSLSPPNDLREKSAGAKTQHGAVGLRKKSDTNATSHLNQSRRSTSRIAAAADDLGDLVDVVTSGEGESADSGLAKAQKLLEKFREKNWQFAEMLLDRYLGGTGEEVTLPSSFVQDYPTLRLGYRGVFRNLSRWFLGDVIDSRVGEASLPMHDGDEVTIGSLSANNAVELNDFVMWEATFKGAGGTLDPIDKLALDDEVHASIGGGTLQGFLTNLNLVREGNVIKVSGVMTFRVRDVYKFDAGHWLGFDEIEAAGQAKRFTVFSEPWSLNVEGTIVLHDEVPIDARIGPVDRPGLGSQFPDPLQDSGFFIGP